MITGVLALIVLLLVGVAVPGTIAVPPGALYEAGAGSREPPACRAPSAGEARDRGLDRQGKAATFSVSGEYLCERTIFGPGERSAYVDFVARQAGARAAGVGRAAASLAAARPELGGRPWTVTVRGATPELAPHLQRVYEGALSSALGAGRVARGAGAGAGAVRLTVTTRPVQDADLLFEVSATADGEGGGTWRL